MLTVLLRKTPEFSFTTVASVLWVSPSRGGGKGGGMVLM